MTSDEKKAFGARIRQLREEKKISQSEFANDFGVTHSCVANWENGLRAPDINIWGKMASYFNVSIDYLCCRSNQKNYFSSYINTLNDNIIDISALDEKGKAMMRKYYNFLLKQNAK